MKQQLVVIERIVAAPGQTREMFRPGRHAAFGASAPPIVFVEDERDGPFSGSSNKMPPGSRMTSETAHRVSWTPRAKSGPHARPSWLAGSQRASTLGFGFLSVIVTFVEFGWRYRC